MRALRGKIPGELPEYPSHFFIFSIHDPILFRRSAVRTYILYITGAVWNRIDHHIMRKLQRKVHIPYRIMSGDRVGVFERP